MNFDQAFELLLGHEGGYSDHPSDKGGRTRFGVTEAVARAKGYTGDMRDLPLQLAKEIYRADYWDRIRADELPAGLRYVMFDAAVNSGPPQAVKWLQAAIGETVDGIIGPRTLSATRQLDANALKLTVLSQRLQFMTNLPTWPAFGKGWARRIADLMEA